MDMERNAHTKTTVQYTQDDRVLGGHEMEPDLESTLAVPPCFREGSLRIMSPDATIRFMLPRAAAAPEAGIAMTRMQHDVPRLGFCIVTDLNPSSRAWLEGSDQKIPLQPGRSYVNSPNGIIRNEIRLDGRIRLFDLFLDPDRLRDALEDDGQASPALKRLFEEPGREPVLLSSPTDPRAAELVLQVEECPLTGGLRRLYLESKAIELAVILLAPHQGSAEDTGRGPKPGTTRRMEEIRRYFDNRIDAPPSLAETARVFGISVSKLKRDFRLTYGCAPHQYALSRRLEKARAHILKDGMSVKEASWTAGYRSMSYFSQAYRRRFGRPPGSDGYPFGA